MSVFCSLECYHVFFGIFILGLQCTSFCALPKTPIFSFYCNLMLQIWVHLSTLRHMWSGWWLKFLCRHTLLNFFFCEGSFLCATFTIIMTMMDRGLTWMILYTTLVNSKLYKNSINVYITLVLKLNRDFFMINCKTRFSQNFPLGLNPRFFHLPDINLWNPLLIIKNLWKSFPFFFKHLYCNLPCTIALYNWQIVFNCIVMGIDFQKINNGINCDMYHVQWGKSPSF